MINDWIDHKTESDIDRVQTRGTADVMLAGIAKQLVRESASYEAGFEAGVLAGEAGLGRYSD